MDANSNNDQLDFSSKVGVAIGLTCSGQDAELLIIEVNILDGKGSLELTGNLGNIMKESAKVALSCIRSLPEIKKLPDDYFEKHIIHVNVPKLYEPKDGPDIGVAIALASYSALLNREVDGRIVLTGEITLKGNILPVDGIKEKITVSKNSGITKVLIPENNRKDTLDIEKDIKDGIEIVYISRIEDVIEHSIIKRTFSLKK